MLWLAKEDGRYGKGLARSGGDGAIGCSLRIRLPSAASSTSSAHAAACKALGRSILAHAAPQATLGDLLEFLAAQMGMLPQLRQAEEGNYEREVAARTEEFARAYAVFVGCATSPRDASDAGNAVDEDSGARGGLLELCDDASQPTLLGVGLGPRSTLYVRRRAELAPKLAPVGSLPAEWQQRGGEAAPKRMGLAQPLPEQSSQQPSQQPSHPGFANGLDAFLSELTASRGVATALTLPGGRLTAMLHGKYRFDETPFERAGMLILVCEPTDDGELLLSELPPLLRFQSMAIVLPERTRTHKHSTPESWADDLDDVLAYLHDSQSVTVVRGLIGHGRAGEACLLYANRTAEIAEREAAEEERRASATAEERRAWEAAEEKAKRRCRGGCGCLATWHDTHCCKMCEMQPGEHGLRCEQKRADPLPKRYDVRSLVLLGCSHEAADGSTMDASRAFKVGWRVYSVHGGEDDDAEVISAQVFHSMHRGHGHQLKLLAEADHGFSGFVPAVGAAVNDWFEGARRLTSDDLATTVLRSGGGRGEGSSLLLLGGCGGGAGSGEDGGDEDGGERRKGAGAGDREGKGGGAMPRKDNDDGEEARGRAPRRVAAHVNLSGTRPNSRMLGSMGIVWLVEELKADTRVLSLDLSCNSIRATGATALATALELNTTLSSLDMRSNALLASGARAFGRMLRTNRALTCLNVRSNGIGACGAAALAEALASSGCALTCLNLRDNAIMAWGAAAIASALHSNSSLSELDLSENLLKEGGAAAVGDLLRRNAVLTSISLRYNGLRSGAVALCGGLASNATLRTLDLRQNDLGVAELHALAEMLESNTCLAELSLEADFPNDAECSAHLTEEELTTEQGPKEMDGVLKLIESRLRANAESKADDGEIEETVDAAAESMLGSEAMCSQQQQQQQQSKEGGQDASLDERAISDVHAAMDQDQLEQLPDDRAMLWARMSGLSPEH